MNRRIFLKQTIKILAFLGAGWFLRPGSLRAEDQSAAPASSQPLTAPPEIGTPLVGNKIEIERTETEWKHLLTSDQYWVLRLRGTEAAFSSPLNNEHRQGTFFCVGCDLPLYSSATKFDSGTGWPSFYAPLPNAVATMVDHELGYARTEVHCRRCGCHLGHVFEDGPKPTGLRYCMNGVALIFRATA
jgi:peptide-methionine (R)-S-oxide reductase